MGALQFVLLPSPRPLFLPFAMKWVIFEKSGESGSVQNWREPESVP